MKKGQILTSSFREVIDDILWYSNSEDELMRDKRVIGFKKIRHKIKLKETMKIVITISNSTLLGTSLKPINSRSWEMHPTTDLSLLGCQTWEITNLGSMIRGEKLFKRTHSINKYSDPFCFLVSENGDLFADDVIDIFSLAENVKLVDDKWEYIFV